MLRLLYPENKTQLAPLNLAEHWAMWEFLTDGSHLICTGKGKSNIISLLALSLCLSHLQSNDTRRFFKVLGFAQIPYNGFTLHANTLRNGSVYQQLKPIYLNVLTL